MQVSQTTFSRLIGYSPRTVAEVEAGAPASAQVRRSVAEVEELFAHLKDIVPADRFSDWLNTPNHAFAGRSPLQLIESGKVAELWRMVYEIETGQLS